MVTIERTVTYWAVSGERWCNVTGYLDEKTAADWVADGWRLVTRVREKSAPVFGKLEVTDSGKVPEPQ